MYHKISEMCDKIGVIYQKSLELRRLKYKSPGPDPEWEKTMVDNTIADIQSLCREVAADTSVYTRQKD